MFVAEPTNESGPVPPLGSRLKLGRPKLGWLKALVVSARICKLTRSPSANDLPAERLTTSIPESSQHRSMVRSDSICAPGSRNLRQYEEEQPARPGNRCGQSFGWQVIRTGRSGQFADPCRYHQRLQPSQLWPA